MAKSIYLVGSTQELNAAYDALASSGGGTIRLLPSEEPYVLARGRHNDTSVGDPVTILSHDPEDRAVLSRLSLINQEHVTVSGVDFAEAAGRDREIITLHGSSDVTISDFRHEGAARGILQKGQAGAADLAMVRGSEGIVIEDGHAQGFGAGIAIRNSRDVSVRDVEMTRWTGDGFFLLGSQDVVIERNHLHDPLGADQNRTHSDFVQLTTTHATAEMERVTIRGNHFEVGDGPSYQGVFSRHFFDTGWMREHDRPNSHRGLTDDGEQRYFHDITITDNVIRTANANVIAANGFRGASVIGDNTTLFAEGAVRVHDGVAREAEPGFGRISVGDSEGVVVTGNIAEGYRVTGGANEAHGNAVISFADRASDDHAHDHLVNAQALGAGDLRDLSFRPDSRFNEFGSSQTRWSERVEALTATATVERSATDLSAHVLDAGLTRDAEGRAALDGAEVVWTFDDGTVRHGARVEHDFDGAGLHGYALTVTLADGRRDAIERVVAVEDPELAAFDLALGADGALANLALGDVAARVHAAEITEAGLVLSGEANFDAAGRKTSGLTLEGSAAALSGEAGFRLGVTLAPLDGSSGVFVSSHGRMEARVTSDGRVAFWLETADGATARVVTDEPVFEGAAGARQVDLVFDGVAGTIAVHVDGRLAGLAEAAGGLGRLGRDVVVGEQFGAPIRALVERVTLDLEGLDEAGVAAAHLERAEGLSAAILDLAPLEARDDALAVRAAALHDGPGAPTHGVATFAVAELLANDDAPRSARVHVVPGSVDDGRLAISDDGAWATYTYALGDFDGLASFDYELRDAHGRSAGATARLEVASLRPTARDDRVVIGDDGAIGGAIGANDVAGRGAQREVVSVPDDPFRVLSTWLQDGETSLSLQLTEADAPRAGAAFGYRVRDQFGVSDVAAVELGVEPWEASDALLHLAFDGEVADALDARTRLSSWNAAFAGEGEGPDLAFEFGPRAAVEVDRGHAFLFDRDAFAFSLDLDARANGKLLQMPHTMQAAVVGQGDDVAFTLTTDEGTFSTRTRGGALSGEGAERVVIGYDDEAGVMQIWVDGDLSARTEATGTTAPGRSWGLTLGSRWGNGFEGTVDDLVMSGTFDPLTLA